MESKTEAAMSELVPEPRQKPAVPMKPMGINANLLGYIGIDTIIEQMRKKTMKTGFDFNIMVVGRQRPVEVLGAMAGCSPMRPGRQEGACSRGKDSWHKARRCLQPFLLPAWLHPLGLLSVHKPRAFSLQSSGQSGLGKSTLVNTLFKSQVSRKSSGWNREEKIPKTVEIKAIGHGKIQAAGVQAMLMLQHGPAEDPSTLCEQYVAVRQPFLHGKLKKKCQF